jgi:hypothetical protein
MRSPLQRLLRQKEREAVVQPDGDAPEASRQRGRRRILALGLTAVAAALAAVAGIRILVATEVAEPLRGLEATASESLPEIFSRVSDLTGSAQVNAERSTAWLRGRGVESAALPAAALAYRQQFGHAMDEDLDEHSAEVEAWLTSWQAAYNRGEPWARGMAQR